MSVSAPYSLPLCEYLLNALLQIGIYTVENKSSPLSVRVAKKLYDVNLFSLIISIVYVVLFNSL